MSKEKKESKVEVKRRDNRNAGHRWERDCIEKMKDIGYNKAVSSRLESRSRDNAKVDICYTDPFNIQCKSMASPIKYEEVLNEMPNDGNINVIFHRKLKKANYNFKTIGELVILRLEDFLKMINKSEE